MELVELQNKALELRKKFAQYEIKNTGREWSNINLVEGFVGDVGDLMKIIMAKEGVRVMDDIDNKLEHEISDCLWSILVIAKKYNIDLEKAFLKTIDDLTLVLENKLKN